MTKNFTNIAYEFWDIVFVKIKVLALEEFYKLKYCSTVVYMVPRA